MINKVILVGNLGQDPEQKFTQAGVAVTNFSVATTERWKGQDGQMQEQTEWHKVVAWKQLAELCNEYLHKGSKVYVEGKNQTRKWQDNDGNDRYTTEVVAREVKFLDPRGSGDSGGSGGGDQGGDQQQNNTNNQNNNGGQGGGAGSNVPF